MRDLNKEIDDCLDQAEACRQEREATQSQERKDALLRQERTLEGRAKQYEFTKQLLDLPESDTPVRTRKR